MKLSKPRSCVSRNVAPTPSREANGASKKRRLPRSILQVNNLQGRRFHSTLEVEIEDCASFGDLKRNIAVQKNLFVITLLYRGVPLDDARQLEKLLPDLAISVRRPRALPGGVIVTILILSRLTFQVTFHSLDSTLRELKEAIQGYEGMSLDQICLHYAGETGLGGPPHIATQYKLEPGCKLHHVGRLRVGYMPQDIPAAPVLPDRVGFVDLENTSLLCKIRLNPRTAPVSRACIEGLNVEGMCWNHLMILHSKTGTHHGYGMLSCA